ncbi:S1C family serine protease [Raineyella sp. LH-20]|uniref:S1C family serine protease n=1 Tax=Raineyella sp. LH-20 TaxID=3081204 RepID=UPI002954CF6C|nr:trypsin-like peptidase domain-containing protein [Raineyella sp. LH-20]WOP17820.1 trypsin-like peptidase domain-containing protein [Raineyella sp. LH-20]
MSERPGSPSFEPPAGSSPSGPPQAGQPAGQPQAGRAQAPYGQPPYAEPWQASPQWQPPAPGQAPGPLQTRRRTRNGSGRLVALVLVGALLGGGVGSAATLAVTGTGGQVVQGGGTTTPVVQGNGNAVDWATVAKSVEPAVVSITVSSGSSGAQGSGVILDVQGHIATNNHVVSGGQNGQIQVTLNNNTIYNATIVGTDPGTDLAVIKMTDPPKDLTPIAFGDVSKVAVGDPVMAIGNPLGLSGSVTTGIVSALHRPVRSSTSEQQQPQSPFSQGQNQTADSTVVTDAIQTSAAINPGNSGGALVNASGQLIGLTSSIATLGGSSGSQSGNIGIGFAIRADQVRSVTQELIAKGSATTPLLGVTTADGVGTVDGQQVVGAEVKSVTSGSPAAQAGITEGDVITAMDGVPITGSVSLAARVRSQQVGDAVTLDVSRNGGTRQVKVTLVGR